MQFIRKLFQMEEGNWTKGKSNKVIFDVGSFKLTIVFDKEHLNMSTSVNISW